MSQPNDNRGFTYDNDYSIPVEDYILDNSITDEMQQPEPVAAPSQEEPNAIS